MLNYQRVRLTTSCMFIPMVRRGIDGVLSVQGCLVPTAATPRWHRSTLAEAEVTTTHFLERFTILDQWFWDDLDDIFICLYGRCSTPFWASSWSFMLFQVFTCVQIRFWENHEASLPTRNRTSNFWLKVKNSRTIQTTLQSTCPISNHAAWPIFATRDLWGIVGMIWPASLPDLMGFVIGKAAN